MARPRKTGLDYFPLDVCFDGKVEVLEVAHGNDGLAVWIKLLQLAYQTEDGEVNLADVLWHRTVAKRANVSPKLLTEIIETCVSIDLFSREHWESKKIVTSSGIKKRIDSVSHDRQQKRLREEAKKAPPSALPPPQVLTSTRSTKEKVKVKENPPFCGTEPLSPIWEGCTYFRMSEKENLLSDSWYINNGFTLELKTLSIQEVDRWLGTSAPKARAARKAPTHYLQLYAAWVIDNATKIISSGRRLNGTHVTAKNSSPGLQALKREIIRVHNEGRADEQKRDATIDVTPKNLLAQFPDRRN